MNLKNEFFYKLLFECLVNWLNYEKRSMPGGNNAPFYKSIMIIPVDVDEHFIVEMLSKVKVLFIDVMLHEICKRKSANDENDANVINM